MTTTAPSISDALKLLDRPADDARSAAAIAWVIGQPAYHAARLEGMSRRQAWRWVLYLQLKRFHAETPITLDEAARQCEEVRP